MSQTSYSQYQAPAFAGMLADLTGHDIDSMAAEGGTIPFGVPVIGGTNKERQVKLVGTGVGNGALVSGFSVATHSAEQPQGGGAVGYEVGKAVSRLRKGRFWVMTDDAVAADSVANLKLSSGLLTDEPVGAGIEAITRFSVRFLTATAAAGLAMVEVK